MKFSEYQQYDGLGLAKLVANKDVHPHELLLTALLRAAEVNPKLNAIIIPMHDYAQQRSQLSLEGAFAGVPFLVKDLFQEIKGYPSTFGSQAYKTRKLYRSNQLGNRQSLGESWNCDLWSHQYPRIWH